MKINKLNFNDYNWPDDIRDTGEGGVETTNGISVNYQVIEGNWQGKSGIEGQKWLRDEVGIGKDGGPGIINDFYEV